MKSKLPLFVVAVLAIVCLLIQKRELNRNQMENASLRQEIAAGLNEKQQPQVSEAGTAPAKTDDGESEERIKEHSELLRLRGEVGVLRQQLLERRQTGAEVSAVSDTNYAAPVNNAQGKYLIHYGMTGTEVSAVSDTDYAALVKDAQSKYHMPLKDLIHYGIVPQRPNDHQ